MTAVLNTRIHALTVEVERLDPDAIIPTQGNPGDAGYDLYSKEDFVLNPGQRRLFLTGIAMAIPEGHVGLVKPRSGLALKKGIDVLGGVIDSGYRGNIGVILLNTDRSPVSVTKGERIAQMLVQPVMGVELREVPFLESFSARGAGGFGSTGSH